MNYTFLYTQFEGKSPKQRLFNRFLWIMVDEMREQMRGKKQDTQVFHVLYHVGLRPRKNIYF